MAKDEMRVGCFERTGCLIQMKKTAEADEKIRPQGVKSKVVVPDTIDEDVATPDETMTPEQSLEGSSDALYDESNVVVDQGDIVVDEVVENDELADNAATQSGISVDDGEHVVQDDSE